MEQEILLGNSKMHVDDNPVSGGFIDFQGETFYKISNYTRMDPFFMTILSNSDHWMFISSNGALTAGRKDPDHALFPYYTVDKIQDSAEITGSKTVLLVKKENSTFLWEPFSDKYNGIYKTERNIYKNIYGNKILFEEINVDLGIVFSYCWMNSETFGFIRRSNLTNIGDTDLSVSVIDGIQNILPAGLNRSLQLTLSNLVDAYKKSELIVDQSIALYMLSAVIVDRAEPSEALNTTVVWSEGMENAKILLSSNQINNFRRGVAPEIETDIRATRGAYFLNGEVNLTPGEEKVWHIIADLDKDAGYVASLKQFLNQNSDLATLLQEDITGCTHDIIRILASSDGLQLTRDQLSVNRHLSNVFFNLMRGGIFADHYSVSKSDLIEFISGANKTVCTNNLEFIGAMEATINYPTLIQQVANHGDPQLVRLCYEYLPLAFSRRHGDPSRPWNLFAIEMKREDGTMNLNYQGNWRDIFQNWEALCLSYPSFTESMICKFLNASTADGYNPFRITRNGIDWDTPDPHDPWSSIGYWGDHQIIYLQKFLETSTRFHPEALNGMLSRNIFAYANVPYRIKSYQDIQKDPYNTIVFNEQGDQTAHERVKEKGSDGKLIWNQNGEVLLVNFTEKLLVTVLAKLSNFIPEAGIWLNTQRPEWNDANNALVGNGVSMVTLYYMRRLGSFCLNLFNAATEKQIEVSAEVSAFFNSILDTLIRFEKLLSADISDHTRKLIVDELGMAGSDYRDKIYNIGFSGSKNSIPKETLSEFFGVMIKYIDHTIRKNKRSDHLYHAYNLISINHESISIRHLYEMLEGQVAVLSAGALNTSEVNDLLDALKKSAMFRNDQYSYMLYPDRQLKRFTEKNIIPAELVVKSPMLIQHITDNNKSVITIDVEGYYHFNSHFRNASDLKNTLDSPKNTGLSSHEKTQVLEIFEKVFDHQSFTGRSGAFYGYEGLGCIYWHMVSKLLLAISENYFSALRNNANTVELYRLQAHYFDVRKGLGFNKSPEIFGAFPTDPYSHTPGNGGARQPGMTGQVKEDIISRLGELGLFVEEGKITFNPGLLRKSEFLDSPHDFQFVSLQNKDRRIALTENSLVFTFCQIPIVYHIAEQNRIKISKSDGQSIEMQGLTIDQLNSEAIFNRSDSISQVDVFITPKLN